MDNFNDSQLLMCEKEVLIKYINDLKTDRDTMLESCGDLDNMEECVGYVNDLKEDNENLKKDYDKNWAAMECLSFMDYKYEDGEWKPYED